MSETEIELFKEPMALSEVFVKSGMFPDVKSQAQGVVKILAGKELGLTPFQSMGGLFFVNGQIGIKANILSGLIKKSKIYDYTIIKLTVDNCEIDFFDTSSPNEPKLLGRSIFGKTEAARAGLINKDNYKNYPEAMYFARAISQGAKRYTPDAIMGYSTVEELQDIEPEIIAPKTTVILDVGGKVTNGKT